VDPVLVGLVAVLAVVPIGLVLLVLAKAAVAVGPDEALVISSPGGTRVAMQPAFVLPLVARGERVDLGMKTIAIARSGRDALSCNDGVRAEIQCELVLSVGRDVDSILRVAQTFGAAKTFDQAAIRAAFETKLVEALAMVIVTFDIESLIRHRDELKDRVLEVLGRDISGFVVHDLVIGRLEQAPREAHDPENIRDARGILKITEETVREAQRAAVLERELRLHRAHLRTDLEVQIAEILARRTEMFASLERATGKRVDMDAVDEVLGDRLRELAKLERDAAS
jgi:uncharacterized membrane protein YqiK